MYREWTGRGEWFVLPSSSNFSSGWNPTKFGDPAKGDVPLRYR
jgi:hypothetical protein